MLFSRRFSTLVGMEKLTRREFVLAASIGGLAAFSAMLAVMLLLVMAGVVPLGQKPATVINVVTPSAKMAPPREAEPKPEAAPVAEAELPQWAVKLADELNTQEEEARRKRIDAQYVAHLSQQLRHQTDPGVISKYIDPVLDPEKMGKGDVGTFATIRVAQIIDRDVFLAIVDDGDRVLIAGISTADLADGRVFKGREQVFEVAGPISYETVLGAKATVMAVKLIDATEFRKTARARLKADWEIRTGKKAKADKA